MNNDVYILLSARTPMGKYGGSFKNIKITDLASQLIVKTFDKLGIVPQNIDELIIGNTIQANTGQNVAREIIYKTNMRKTITGYTVNEVCASGMKAIINGVKDIKCGEANAVIACGVENMSNAPFMIEERFGLGLGDAKLMDSLIIDGLKCGISNQLMGNTAEKITAKYKISRAEQDKFAYESHKKTIQATDDEKFKKQIVSIAINDGKGIRYIEEDETFRRETSIEILSKLRPAFAKGGTVTAGNSSSLADGAAVVILGDKKAANKMDIHPSIRINDWSGIGINPNYMGLGPIKAIQKLLKKNNMKIEDIDLFEINEAFAVQTLVVIRELGIEREKVNVNGGAIALGHPLGCSGARIVVSLAHEMIAKNSRYGIATLCVGGGEGYALLLENVA